MPTLGRLSFFGVLLICAMNAVSSQALELVLFGAPWCVPCHRFQAEVLPRYSHTFLGTKIPITYIDATQPNNFWFIMDQRVVGLPAFLLVKDGQELARFYGYSGIEDFFIKLARAAEGHL